MRVVYNLILTVMIIFDFIEISSSIPPKTMDLLANFGTSKENAYYQEIPAETSLRSRSRSPPAANKTPPAKLPISKVLGYGRDQLESIRLTPYKNPQRQFELRRYTFPADKPIVLLKGPNKYGPVPTEEQVVLSTFDDDIYAILDSADVPTGIYTYDPRIKCKGRAKINMKSGKVTTLTADEIKETPVGHHRQFLNGYRVEHLNYSHEFLPPAQLPHGSRSNSPYKYVTLPTRLPSADGHGYGLDQLQFIRLIPKRNLSHIFELRKYNFPADKLILLHEKESHYKPIPIQELIVLTTLAGDVFAILENSNSLAGLYTYNARTRSKGRVKMNMHSGTVTKMTTHEVWEVPVGALRLISHNFKIVHDNQDSSSDPINEKKF